jgi:hypothetical protein
MMTERVSPLARRMIPVPSFILSPLQAREILLKPGVVNPPLAPADQTVEAAEHISLRDILMIAHLVPDPNTSGLGIKQALERASEPVLSLADFGHLLLPDGKAVLLTNKPLLRAIAGLLGKPELVGGEVTGFGAIYLTYFKAVQSYFNALFNANNLFLYPDDKLAQYINKQSARVLERFGIDSLTMNGSSNPFFSLREDREVTMEEFHRLYPLLPRLGVVLSPEAYLTSYRVEWSAPKKY